MRFKLPTLYPSSSVVVSDACDILESLSRIKEATLEFDNNVAGWDGSVFGALSALKKAANLIKHTNIGIATASSAGPLTLDEAQKIAAASRELVQLVGQAIDNVVIAKPSFDKIVIIGNSAATAIFRELWSATIALSDTLVSKVPAEMNGIAKSIAMEMDNQFAKGNIVFQIDR